MVEKIWGGVIQLEDHKYVAVGVTATLLVAGMMVEFIEKNARPGRTRTRGRG